MPKLMYLLQSSHPDLHADFNDYVKSSTALICNVSFDDIGWIQANFLTRVGGIGLHHASDIALPAYLASTSDCRSLIS